MNGLTTNTTVKRLSRRYRSGYEPLDEAMRSETLRDPPRRSMSFKRKNAEGFLLRTAEDEARQRRQIFINSYKFETAEDKSQPFVCCRKMNKVVCKVKTSVAKLVSSVSEGAGGAFRSCNCRLAVQAFSPKPRNEWF